MLDSATTSAFHACKQMVPDPQRGMFHECTECIMIFIVIEYNPALKISFNNMVSWGCSAGRERCVGSEQRRGKQRVHKCDAS